MRFIIESTGFTAFWLNEIRNCAINRCISSIFWRSPFTGLFLILSASHMVFLLLVDLTIPAEFSSLTHSPWFVINNHISCRLNTVSDSLRFWCKIFSVILCPFLSYSGNSQARSGFSAELPPLVAGFPPMNSSTAGPCHDKYGLNLTLGPKSM